MYDNVERFRENLKVTIMLMVECNTCIHFQMVMVQV